MEELTGTGRRKLAREGGGGFIVSGVFNDSSKMYIPAPPSPTPDYDDDANDTDGDESDILHNSQFYVTEDISDKGSPNKNRKKSKDNNKKLDVGNMRRKGNSALQNMMDKFHEGLPKLHSQEDECHFSDDSLEGLQHIQKSNNGGTKQFRKIQDSVESLESIGESTASFDYLTSEQSKAKSNKESSRPIIASGGLSNQRSQKDVNNKVKKSVVKPKNVSGQKELKNKNANQNKPSRQDSHESVQSTSSSSSKHSEKFDTIRNMLKQGLIEGLDEDPPNFKPPPPPKTKGMSSSNSEERADSGLGSTVSTNRTDESGGSDNHSDQSTSPPSLITSSTTTPTSTDPVFKKDNKLKDNKSTVRSNISEVHEKDRDEGDEVEVYRNDKVSSPSPPPPRPPPRDSSMSSTSQNNISNSSNSSWLHNNKRPNQKKPSANYYGKKPAVPPPRNEMLEVPQSSIYSRNPGKITHVDDIYGKESNDLQDYEAEDNPLTDREFIENLKNQEPHHSRPDSLPVISEDRTSIGSRSSTRSSRILSRFADSMKNGLGSRPSTPSNSTTRTTTKLTSVSRSSTWIHGDIIREPWKNSNSILPNPSDYPQLVSPSTVVPLSRDGSGRFRSIEDLAEASSREHSDHGSISEKRKKHSTLPPNLTPADIRKENKELRRATSLMCSNKG